MIDAVSVSFLAAQVFFFLIFLLSVKRDKYATVDIFWGLSILFNGLVLAFIFFERLTPTFIAVLIGVALWGLRLSYHLYHRNWKAPEDFRYVEMRSKWVGKEKRNAYLKIFVTQGFFSFIMSLALVGALLIEGPLSWLSLAVAGLTYGTGLYFETAADVTLATFKKDPAQKGQICTQGVWGLSRHPNYFGEITLWWSYPVLMLLNGLNVGLILGLISALVITWLLVFVSGVPLLEKRYLGDPRYDAYKQVTPMLIPGLKKRDPKVSK